MEREIKLEIEELEERIAPSFLGGNSKVEWFPCDRELRVPQGNTGFESVIVPEDAVPGLNRAETGRISPVSALVQTGHAAWVLFLHLVPYLF